MNTDLSKPIVIAVAGNPNSGKSTLINAFAGTRLQVGNWAGVTVEKKEAIIPYKGRILKIVDLPGTYSLSPYSQEEVIAREFLLEGNPDIILNVVDATNLERNLYLTAQLMEMEVPMVMAMNVYDEAEKKGFKFNLPLMADLLGIRVVPTISTRGKGVEDLFDAVLATFDERDRPLLKKSHHGEDLETAAEMIAERIKTQSPDVASRYPLRWTAFKVMEGDSHVLSKFAKDDREKLIGHALDHLKTAHGHDIEGLLTDARHGFGKGLALEVLSKPAIQKIDITEKLDAIFLNRILGIPLFFIAMWLMFKLTFDIASPFADWIDSVVSGPLSRWASVALHFLSAPSWVASLATEGVVNGVGFVLTFVPVIFSMMFFLTFLEGSGYMARAAFVMDRAMHVIGLHGKSFIPMLLGFGCNVPAIYATRTLENRRDKILTALLVPLMSCGARLPVYVLFVSVFFTTHSGLVLWSLYLMGILLAVLMGLIFKKTLFRGEAPVFIMELPPYRIPTLKNLAIHTWEKGKHFLVKAGTYIFAVSIFVWFLLNLPWGVQNRADSVLGKTGAFIAPVLEPLGFGTWQAASSLITGVIAKEIIVSSMGEIYSVTTDDEASNPPTFSDEAKDIATSFGGAVAKAGANILSTFGIKSLSIDENAARPPLRSAVHKVFTPLSAYAFMAFVLLYMPCVVVAIAMKQEFGSWKWFALSFTYQTALAWFVAFAIYQGGTLLGWGGGV